MHQSPHRLRVWLLLFALLGTACAVSSTGVVPTLSAGAIQNPEQGLAVRIVEVEDAREFQDTAAARLVPSLRGEEDDPTLRARAVGRTALPNGRPGANVLLEPPLTIESILTDATHRALRGAGFRVVAEGDPDFASATELRLVVDQLWMMRNPPYSSPFTFFELKARLAGPLPGLETGAPIDASQKIVRGGFNRAMWRQALEQGLDEYTQAASESLERVQAALKATPAERLAPAQLAIIPNPRPPEEHAIDYGRYFLLAIGIDDYEALPRLRTAVSDARAVARLLESAYGYETELLLNASRADLIQTLGQYRDRMGPKDNLLIYYAGHGWNDEAAQLAYWLPIDADPDDETNWVSNAKITSILRAMQAKHVMVVSDSCYSGTLTRGLQVSRKGPGHLERLISRRTRLALASGGNEPVVDGGGGKHSIFANVFLRVLRENESVLDATTLHSRIRPAVMRDAQQTPQFGPIRSARHEDGDFLFVRTDRD